MKSEPLAWSNDQEKYDKRLSIGTYVKTLWVTLLGYVPRSHVICYIRYTNYFYFKLLKAAKKKKKTWVLVIWNSLNRLELLEVFSLHKSKSGFVKTFYFARENCLNFVMGS